MLVKDLSGLDRKGLLQSDDVVPWIEVQRRRGRRVALVTVVGVEGGSPRGVGAQMAVRASNDYTGYLSGGCLEQAVAQEAECALAEGRNRLIRYGKGSRFLDIRLPCGAGLDIYIDQGLDDAVIQQLGMARSQRNLVSLRMDLSSGRSDVVAFEADVSEPQGHRRLGDIVSRVYVPPLRLQIIGIGPALAAIATVADALGFEVLAASPNDRTRAELAANGFAAAAMSEPALPHGFDADLWTAAVLAFHEHDWEPPLLEALLDTPAFFIGAVGNRAVHQARLAGLQLRGVDAARAARVRGPIGLIAGAKSRASLAISILAEIVDEAKSQKFIA